ncbi:16S rRNA (cytosine967-C5)-methyltransferase [Croceifilum oryzae]|uniref:16S rRNA (cytosine(967)-C(5))-methyltransferase n=1 Tax=Croceifilum oryzae TaxID=1553429 RepID=A0AAJ1WSZ9_9BACL|nr:16S rRNA (cytosine(967)-C(5))-methyltransferase RsmB [Croceifilum oryzae]MDQ0416471.1 16S rRNA (cytosine967-C5)-methyltransferase [Croceifilum oryzae]
MKKNNQRQSARDVALDILIQYESKEAFSNLLLNQSLERSQLEPRDKRLVTELVYGVIQRQNSLDWVIDKLISRGSKSVEPWVRQLLRMGLYQMIYLDKIPERAAVHETVEIAKARGHKGISGLVNGVLRNFLRNKEKFSPTFTPTSHKEEAIVYSHPLWMVKRLHEVYGDKEAVKALQAQNQPPKVSVRINSMRWDRDAFIEAWNEEETGGASPSELALDGVILKGVGNAASHFYYQEGAYTIQDESSMLVARAVDPKPGMRVLDACAAPGGKATHLAERMNDEGTVIAYDVHNHKMDLIREQARRLDLEHIKTRVSDAREIELDGEPLYDAILLDAPCSGLGVIHRKPDIKWSKETEQIRDLTKIQSELLDRMATLVKPGGTLVYSTCTWEPQENREQVEQFLKRHPEFELDPTIFELLPGIVKKRGIAGDGWIQLLPHHFNSDGFFIARMKRQA